MSHVWKELYLTELQSCMRQRRDRCHIQKVGSWLRRPVWRAGSVDVAGSALQVDEEKILNGRPTNRLRDLVGWCAFPDVVTISGHGLFGWSLLVIGRLGAPIVLIIFEWLAQLLEIKKGKASRTKGWSWTRKTTWWVVVHRLCSTAHTISKIFVVVRTKIHCIDGVHTTYILIWRGFLRATRFLHIKITSEQKS